MNSLLDLLIVAFVISLSANIASFYYLKHLNERFSAACADHQKKLEAAVAAEKKKPELSLDAKAILADLASGPALVKIEYVDRADVLLRSPRHL